jgi:hypothetical protein
MSARTLAGGDARQWVLRSLIPGPPTASPPFFSGARHDLGNFGAPSDQRDCSRLGLVMPTAAIDVTAL